MAWLGSHATSRDGVRGGVGEGSLIDVLTGHDLRDEVTSSSQFDW